VRKSIFHYGALVLLIALVASACSTSDSTATTTAGTETATTAPAESDTTATAPVGASLTVGFPGPIGFTDVPVLMTGSRLVQEAGWSFEFIEFDSPDLLTQALVTGDVDIASMGPATVMAATVQGADLKIISNNNNNDWLVVSGPQYDNCGELDGELVAYHSEGGTSTAMLLQYMGENCPEAAPDYLVMSGSLNRATALLNGDLDGTVVRLEDWVTATSANPDGGKILANLAEGLPNLLTQTLVVSGEWLASNRDVAVAYITALLATFEEVNQDIAELSAEAKERFPDVDPEALDEFIDATKEQGLFPADGGLSEEKVAGTIKFYEDIEKVEKGAVTVDDILDMSVLDEAMS